MNHRLMSGIELQGEPARLELKARVEAGLVHGTLAFDGQTPIGWCAFDRMAELPGLDCGYPVDPVERNSIWAIHCISVLSDYDEEKVSSQLIVRAVQEMKNEGAKLIEAYPPDQLPSDNSFSGSIKIYQQNGFNLKERINAFYNRMVLTV